ncbi:MAG: hypothetical protein K6F34_11290 [Lachnospiraceae bacterium]|nr:hypothetical protein [Lachnospiraceae bacterium]
MERFLNKLERRFGRYSIRNLAKYLVYGYGIGYLLYFAGNAAGVNLFSLITLDPYKIIHGQIWRIITWIIVPPQISFWAIFLLLIFISFGNTLERTWGTFRFNVYIFSGILFTVIGAFVMYAAYYLAGYTAEYPPEILSSHIGYYFLTYYVYQTIFFACAVEYPNIQMLLMFFIPVKLKWIAIFMAFSLGIDFLAGNWETKISIIASLLNFALFFFGTRNYKRVSPAEIRRRQAYKQETKRISHITRHKCAICGRTEKDGDDLEFRFCSKCNGNYEYCQDHLFTHEHVR